MLRLKIYKIDNFEKSRGYLRLNLEYPEFSRGFRWLLRARCGYKIDASVAKAAKLVNNSCSNFCPCCYNISSRQRIDHWFISCFLFKEFRSKYFSSLNSHFFILLNNLFKSLQITRDNSSSNNNDFISIVEGNNNNSNLERNRNVNWYRIYIFFIGGRKSKCVNDADNYPYKREWNNLYKCQTKPGVYTDIPFLLRSAAILNNIMPVACRRQHILFNKFKTNLSNNVNADNTVGQPSRDLADPSGIG